MDINEIDIGWVQSFRTEEHPIVLAVKHVDVEKDEYFMFHELTDGPNYHTIASNFTSDMFTYCASIDAFNVLSEVLKELGYECFLVPSDLTVDKYKSRKCTPKKILNKKKRRG